MAIVMASFVTIFVLPSGFNNASSPDMLPWPLKWTIVGLVSFIACNISDERVAQRLSKRIESRYSESRIFSWIDRASSSSDNFGVSFGLAARNKTVIFSGIAFRRSISICIFVWTVPYSFNDCSKAVAWRSISRWRFFSASRFFLFTLASSFLKFFSAVANSFSFWAIFFCRSPHFFWMSEIDLFARWISLYLVLMVDWLLVRSIILWAEIIFFCNGDILVCSLAKSWFSLASSSRFLIMLFLYVSSCDIISPSFFLIIQFSRNEFNKNKHQLLIVFQHRKSRLVNR